MAYTAMVDIVMAYAYGLYSYGLYSYGLNSYGLYSYGLHSYGLHMARAVITVRECQRRVGLDGFRREDLERLLFSNTSEHADGERRGPVSV